MPIQSKHETILISNTSTRLLSSYLWWKRHWCVPYITNSCSSSKDKNLISTTITNPQQNRKSIGYINIYPPPSPCQLQDFGISLSSTFKYDATCLFILVNSYGLLRQRTMTWLMYFSAMLGSICDVIKITMIAKKHNSDKQKISPISFCSKFIITVIKSRI